MRLVDLFAGAGLLSYAFRTRGFNISMAVESDPRAARTYHRNVGAHVICADVRRLVPRGHCDVLVGGRLARASPRSANGIRPTLATNSRCSSYAGRPRFAHSVSWSRTSSHS